MFFRSRLMVVLSVLLMMASPISTIAQRDGSSTRVSVNYSFTEAVSTLDQVLIKEGIRFAQDSIISTFGSDVGHSVTIIVDYDETRQARHGVSDDSTIYINAANYAYMSSLEETMSVVHEYVHIWQWALGKAPLTGYGSPPLWIVEGGAEFLAWWLLAETGLLTHDEAHAFFVQMANGARAQEGSNLPALQELSTFQQLADDPAIGCCAYHLSGLAIEMLVEWDGIGSMSDFWSALSRPSAQPAKWTDVFEQIYSMSTEAFYEEFEAGRAELLANPGIDVSYLLYTPPYNQDSASIEVIDPPTEFAIYDQLLVRGTTAPGVLCKLGISTEFSEVASIPAYADYQGKVFWLWSPPIIFSDGDTVLFAATCNGVSSEFEVTATSS